MSDDQEKKRTVLIPTDGSVYSQYAYDWYRDHLKRPNDKVTFMKIVEPEFLASPSALGFTSLNQGDMEAQLQKDIASSEATGMKLVEEAKKLNVVPKYVQTVSSQPGKVVVDHIVAEKPDMVVMGSRGLGTLRRTILGSCSDYVLHHADIPVTVVPKPKQEPLIKR